MRYTLIGLGAFLLYLACSDATSSDNGNDKNTEQDSDTTVGTGSGDTESGGTENGGTENDALWAEAWSILGTRCGTQGACHNTSSGGADGINIPSDDEATAKTNAIQFKDRIRSEVASGGMPKGDTLTEDERAKVTDWVDSL